MSYVMPPPSRDEQDELLKLFAALEKSSSELRVKNQSIAVVLDARSSLGERIVRVLINNRPVNLDTEFSALDGLEKSFPITGKTDIQKMTTILEDHQIMPSTYLRRLERKKRRHAS